MTDASFPENRDLHPHKAAVAAMWVYHGCYSRQALGSMGFWDSLSPHEQGVCRDLLAALAKAPNEPKHYCV